MNSTAIFSNRAQKYASYRSSHSEDAIAVILNGLANFSQLVAADIGAGTGIASRQLGDRKIKVFLLVPTLDMHQSFLVVLKVALRRSQGD